MDEALKSIINAAEKSIPAEPNDYEKDGLLHCGKCNTPKEAVILMLGTATRVRCLCKCKAEERNAEERRKRDLEKFNHVAELRSFGLDAKNRSCRFETAVQTKQIATCKRYVAHWDDALKKNVGLFLWGDCGGGKSYAASCIVNALIERNVPCLQTSINAMVQRFRNHKDDTAEILRDLKRYKLLVLDDFGTEGNSEYVMSVAFSIIDTRYTSKLPLIITTNMSVRDLDSPVDVAHKRIYQRVSEMCYPVFFDGNNFRNNVKSEKEKFGEEFLSGN